jgi:hypothetical protein
MALKDWRKTFDGQNITRFKHKNYWPELSIYKQFTEINPKNAKIYYEIIIEDNKSFVPIFRDKFKTKQEALKYAKSYMRKN